VRNFEKGSFKHSYFRLTIARCTEAGFNFVDSILSSERNISSTLVLPAGRYAVLIDAYWVTVQANSFTLSTYSQGEVSLEKINLAGETYNQCLY
jgi:hypothetical protein